MREHGSAKFYDALATGQLVYASNYVAQKLHIVTLRDTAFDDDVRALSKHLSKALREERVAKIDPKRKRMWIATALCGVTGEHAHYGNYSRYFWTPIESPNITNACKGCQKEWKKLGKPDIAGFDQTASVDESWPWELPFGWREVPVDKHPWDVPPGGDVDLVKDDTGEVRGELRTEIKRWQRGTRIVRLVHHFVDDTYSSRMSCVGDKPAAEDWKSQGALADIRESCHELMARGGY
ncbi:MAG: hypothetical protein ACRELY_15580 [Polyangiaceae bacterium]